MKELECILEETNEKSIIWATYVFNIKQIVQMLEKKYGKGATASDIVRADITAKYGKGALMDKK